jgi:hypothetical protein
MRSTRLNNKSPFYYLKHLIHLSFLSNFVSSSANMHWFVSTGYLKEFFSLFCGHRLILNFGRECTHDITVKYSIILQILLKIFFKICNYCCEVGNTLSKIPNFLNQIYPFLYCISNIFYYCSKLDEPLHLLLLSGISSRTSVG